MEALWGILPLAMTACHSGMKIPWPGQHTLYPQKSEFKKNIVSLESNNSFWTVITTIHFYLRIKKRLKKKKKKKKIGSILHYHLGFIALSYCDHLPFICSHLWTAFKTPWPNFFMLHVEPSIKEGLKIYTNGHSPLIKMAAMPTHSKSTKKSSLEPGKLWGWILVFNMRDSRSTKWCQRGS